MCYLKGPKKKELDLYCKPIQLTQFDWKAFFPPKRMKSFFASWSHATNSQALLDNALKSEKQKI